MNAVFSRCYARISDILDPERSFRIDLIIVIRMIQARSNSHENPPWELATNL